jgi:elongation factor Tu
VVVSVNDKIHRVGFGDTKEYVVTGVEMFRKLLDDAQAGDNVGLLLRGADKKDIQRGMVWLLPSQSSLIPNLKQKSIA